METVRVELGERSYNICIGEGLLNKAGGYLREWGLAGSGIIVTDETVHRLYGKAALAALTDSEVEAGTYVLPVGEKYKNLKEARKIYSRMLRLGLERDSFVLSLGGGVVGDLAGFAAATYMRGVNFAQIPTTLLAQVDASAGGKVAVNLPEGKNLVGTFHQPKGVLIDPSVLQTLDKRDLHAGFAEVIKHAAIRDPDYFSYLEDNREKALALEPACLEHIIKRSCRIKASVVSRDEREKRLRMILNFGHTLAHAIEAATSYREYRHGEAVAMGMACASLISLKLKYMDAGQHQRLMSLISSYNLPTRLPGDLAGRILDYLKKDKKARGGRVLFVLPRRIGEVFIAEDVPEETVTSAVTELGAG